jgi:hypothetical protein
VCVTAPIIEAVWSTLPHHWRRMKIVDQSTLIFMNFPLYS